MEQLLLTQVAASVLIKILNNHNYKIKPYKYYKAPKQDAYTDKRKRVLKTNLFLRIE